MKKILTGILALTMALSLAACGGNKASDKDTKELLMSDHWKATSDIGSMLGITEEEYNKFVFFEDGDAFFLGMPTEWKVSDGFTTLTVNQNVAVILDIQEEDGISKIVIDNKMVGLDNLTFVREKDYDKFMEKTEDTDAEDVDGAELPSDEASDEATDVVVEDAE